MLQLFTTFVKRGFGSHYGFLVISAILIAIEAYVTAHPKKNVKMEMRAVVQTGGRF